jgi:hypothetical protein
MAKMTEQKQNNFTDENGQTKIPQKRRKNKLITLAVLSGLLGGAATYGGVTMVQTYIASNGTSVSLNSKSSGTTTVEQTSTSGSSDATKAYNKVQIHN